MFPRFILSKRDWLLDLQDTLRTWEAARSRTDLTGQEIAFLDKAIASTKGRITNMRGRIAA